MERRRMFRREKKILVRMPNWKESKVCNIKYSIGMWVQSCSLYNLGQITFSFTEVYASFRLYIQNAL